jgi:hypothetical protein
MPFAKWRKFKFGNGTARVGFVGQITPDMTMGCSLTAAETVLNTIVMPANSLYKNGFGWRLTVAGHFATNGNNKKVKAYVGSTVLLDSGTLTDSNVNWLLQIKGMRLGVKSHIVWARFQYGATSLPIATSAPNFDETASQTFTVKGTAGTGAADILSYGMTCEVFTL